MEDKNHNNEFVLGQLLGRMDGLQTTMNGISTTFTAHSLSDEKNFTELRQQMIKDKEEMNNDRMWIAKVTGGMFVIMTVVSWLAPLVFNKFI